jgi:hypothetical protein
MVYLALLESLQSLKLFTILETNLFSDFRQQADKRE